MLGYLGLKQRELKLITLALQNGITITITKSKNNVTAVQEFLRATTASFMTALTVIKILNVGDIQTLNNLRSIWRMFMHPLRLTPAGLKKL
ncbi:hypothetical protein DSECCO2_509050 [anaerobic digester metagenome]